MRILFCAFRDLENDLAGGSEVLIDRLASGLVDRGHDVTLLCAEPVAPRAYRVIPNGRFKTQYLRAPFKYLQHARDVDLVVDVANGLPFFASLWRRGPCLCLVNHVHTEQWSLWFSPAMANLGRTIERRAMPWAYRDRLFMAVSPSTAASLERLGVNPGHIRIVTNGVTVPETQPVKSTEPLFLGVGRLVPHKRFDIAIRAWERIRPLVGGRLVIVGEGPDLERLAAIAGDGVEFRGRVSEEEKTQLYGEAWMLLHPAMLEGWGLVITEAAASGTPTLGFRVPGVRDSVIHGRTGLLASDEAEFAALWARLATDGVLRQQYGVAARARAQTLGWDRTVERFENVAQEAVATHRRLSGASRVRTPSGVLDVREQMVDLRDAAAINDLELADADAGRPTVSIVVPAYNEAIRLRTTLPRFVQAIDQTSTELIVVDDGSADGTAAYARKLLDNVQGASVIELVDHLGKGAAVRRGVAAATGQTIAFMDADLAVDLAGFPALLEALESADIAIGSRSAPGSVVAPATPWRSLSQHAFSRASQSVTRLRIADMQCGFKAFRGPAAKLLFELSRENGWAFDVELLALADRLGYRIAEVPVRWNDVRGGHRGASTPAAMFWSLRRIRAAIRYDRLAAAIEPWADADRPDKLSRNVSGPRGSFLSDELGPDLLPGPEDAELRSLLEERLDESSPPASASSEEFLNGSRSSRLRRALTGE
jgi:glycosyltransferase involved in cell wall biosynthesis